MSKMLKILTIALIAGAAIGATVMNHSYAAPASLPCSLMVF